ncbi:MAG: hypothetical protein Q4G43_02150 [Mobilicoccus sp.]|nr:hypothetical protein [Mobilicoccus sp.]
MKVRLFAAASVLAVASATLTVPIAEAAPTAGAARVVADQEGPHSPRGRKIPAPRVSTMPGVQIFDVDFGDVDLGRRAGQFRSPMRGVLVVPEKGRGAPLVVVNHLRMPGCTGEVMAYPCPRGTRELRLDRGMTYLGIDLARQGYAVLIPDLSPLWIGAETSAPYDQIAGWQTIVGGLRDRVAAANRGGTAFGTSLRGRVDTSRSALIVHSRSAYIVGTAVQAWKSTSPVTSVLAYGPAADAEDPAPPDVPYLVTLGSADADVYSTPSHWASAHLGEKRTSPLLVAQVPGLGHSAVNRTLSRAGLDDRRSCEGDCPTARQHEVFLQNTASAWLAATYPSGRTVASGDDIPTSATAPLPPRLGGLAVQWLAATNAPATLVYDSAAGARGVQAFGGGTIAACRYLDPMDPAQDRGRCAEPEEGVVEARGPVLRVGLRPAGGARFAVAPTPGVRQVDVTINPSGSRADRRPGTPLQVTLVDDAGGRHPVDASRTVLRDRRTAEESGVYTPVTLRLPVEVDAAVVAVELTGRDGDGLVEVRRIDLLTRETLAP